ncbi:DUF4157 domain-containing protein [Saccharopolyspora aridisoli]|uniref:DUF4157 domain-containing protein n=1 Tax=Saccharopolyspora aridisoli TaxID=2530385 RepID=A0A4R4V1N6_9PSEU|nr:DUF4157 domain-containing protein [Saccharopolyspora aridisoli]
MRARGTGSKPNEDQFTAHTPNTDTFAPHPGDRSPAAILALQRSIGNAAASQYLHDWQHDPSATVQRSKVHDVLRTNGKPMEEATRAEMESRLGADFSDVRVHNDGAARASAAEIGARAYTSGNHIVIGDGGADRHTLAHELSHVIQQRQGPVAGTDNGAGLSVSDPSDEFERAAESNARKALSSPEPTPKGQDHPTSNASDATGTPVQRVGDKDRKDLYLKWSGGKEGTPRERLKLHNQLKRIAEETSNDWKKMTVETAVSLLHRSNITPETLAEPDTRPQEEPIEKFRERALGAYQETVAQFGDVEANPVFYDIEGVGRGVVALLHKKREGEDPQDPGNMLAWASHGYEDAESVDTDTARSYGFIVEQGKSWLRTGDNAVYSKLPNAMNEAKIEPTKKAPSLMARPHLGDLGKDDFKRLSELTKSCDVAVFLDEQQGYVTTEKPPNVAEIVDRTPALKDYAQLLLFTCRTPWEPGVEVKGSGSDEKKMATPTSARVHTDYLSRNSTTS